MKKFLCMLLILLCFAQISAFAEDNISVTIDDTPIEFDVQPQIIDGRTLVPMRKIFESLGAAVTWVEDAQLIIATHSTDIIAMEIGKDSFSVSNVVTNETETITLDVPPQIIDGRTLVPVRAISESMGLKVDWNGDTQTVIITNE